MNLQTGMLARSKKGRDKDCLYVIISVKDEYVYLSDGGSRPIWQLKKKNRKHIQPIKKAGIVSVDNNEAIRNAIKAFENDTQEMDSAKCTGGL